MTVEGQGQPALNSPASPLKDMSAMRILTAFVFVCLFSPLALAQAAQPDCNKPAAEMTPDEYVACVSVGGVKALAPQQVETGDGKTYQSGAPTAAGRGVTAAGTSEADACSKAKSRAGGTARGSCSCSQKSAGRFECTVPTANILAR
jgi:hypothetical protein